MPIGITYLTSLSCAADKNDAIAPPQMPVNVILNAKTAITGAAYYGLEML